MCSICLLRLHLAWKITGKAVFKYDNSKPLLRLRAANVNGTDAILPSPIKADWPTILVAATPAPTPTPTLEVAPTKAPALEPTKPTPHASNRTDPTVYNETYIPTMIKDPDSTGSTYFEGCDEGCDVGCKIDNAVGFKYSGLVGCILLEYVLEDICFFVLKKRV